MSAFDPTRTCRLVKGGYSVLASTGKISALPVAGSWPRGPPMQRIEEWLKQLGMSEYAQCFAENRIDFSVLPDLTDQHLKDLGLPLGDRLKMLRAIRELSGAVSAPASTEPKAQEAAERRQVTVMFSDLVGSTALSARMDPEDLRKVISAYLKCAAET